MKRPMNSILTITTSTQTDILAVRKIIGNDVDRFKMRQRRRPTNQNNWQCTSESEIEPEINRDRDQRVSVCVCARFFRFQKRYEESKLHHKQHSPILNTEHIVTYATFINNCLFPSRFVFDLILLVVMMWFLLLFHSTKLSQQ